MTFTTEEILKAAAEGAAKYEAEQFEVLKKFCSIDCGSRDEEGNAKIVEIVDGLLKEIKGIDIQHHYFEGYGINIVARLKPENPDFPEGHDDKTHFNAYGADKICGLVADGMRRIPACVPFLKQP